jgi:hypothetical protein
VRTSPPPFAIPTTGPGISTGFAQPPGTQPGTVPGFTLPPPTGVTSNAEEQLKQANDMLRALVELCIQRGVFTRDELWQRLTAPKR